MAVEDGEIEEVTAEEAEGLIHSVIEKLDAVQTEFDRCGDEGAGDFSRILGEMSHDLEKARTYLRPQEPDNATDMNSTIKRAVTAARTAGG